VKVGDLARFRHDGKLVLILNEQRPGIFDGVFVGCERNGDTVTTYESLMEIVDEDR
jgi:hypothetical protein